MRHPDAWWGGRRHAAWRRQSISHSRRGPRPRGAGEAGPASDGTRAPPATPTRSGWRPDSTSCFRLDEGDRPLSPVVALRPELLAQAVDGWDGPVLKGDRHLAPAGPGLGQLPDRW